MNPPNNDARLQYWKWETRKQGSYRDKRDVLQGDEPNAYFQCKYYFKRTHTNIIPAQSQLTIREVTCVFYKDYDISSPHAPQHNASLGSPFLSQISIYLQRMFFRIS